MTQRDVTEAACRRRATCRQYMAAFVANLSAFSIGTMLGWTSPMQPLLSSNDPPVGTEPMSADLISWLGSINFIGALVGSLFWGISSDRLGRKYTAMLVAVPFIISWVLKLAAQNATWLVVARIINGISCSGVIINTPLYVSEMAEDKIRGRLGFFLMIFLNAGCVFSFVVGSLTSYHSLAAVCLCVPLVFLASIAYFPESPVYLWTNGKRDIAEKSLLWFRGGNITQTLKEIEAMKSRPTKSRQSPSFISLLRSKGVRKALGISLSFVFGFQFCGNLAILTYAVNIFQKSGSSLSAHSSMIVVGMLQFMTVVVSSTLVDRAGRRVLLISSYTVMGLSLTILGGYLYFQDTSWDPLFRSIPLICISVTIIFYSIGVGPIPFVVMSEIFPPDIRGYLMSKINLLNTIMSFCSVKAFPILADLLGLYTCFIFYAICCFILSVVTFVILPETKGKTLQTILRILNGDDTKEIDDIESSELVNVENIKIVKIEER